MDFKRLRKSKNITQRIIADAIGVRQSTVAMWERGSSKPQTKNLIAISKCLEVSVEELLDCFKEA